MHLVSYLLKMSYIQGTLLAQFHTKEERLQCAVCEYLLSGPLQFPCGHRICTPCARKLKQQRCDLATKECTIHACMHAANYRI